MNATFDLAVYYATLLYAGLVAIDLVTTALGRPLPLKIPSSVLGIMLLGLVAKLGFTGMPTDMILQSLGIGFGMLAVCFVLFAKGALGAGVAKALPVVLAFLGPDWLGDTLFWVIMIIAAGAAASVAIRAVTGKNQAS